MNTVEVTVDYVLEDGESLDEVVGEVYADAGPVTVTRVSDASHENGGHPVLTVTGTAPRVLAWLLAEYADDLAEALALLGTARTVGAPDRASVPVRPLAQYGPYGVAGSYWAERLDTDELYAEDWARELLAEGSAATEPASGEDDDHGTIVVDLSKE